MPYVCNLSPEIQKHAKEFLNEDPETRDANIEEVRQWINKQPHLNARTDDFFILRFLRACKFSLEKTKQRIENYYTMRNKLPEWFAGRDPQNKDMRTILELGGLLPLPGLDRQGKKSFLSRGGFIDPHKYSVNDLMKAVYMVYETVLDEDESVSIMGMNFIIDMEGFTAAHMLAYTPSMTKKSVVFMQDGSPFRPPKLHYINTTSEFKSFFNLWSKYFNEEMSKMVTVHSGDYSSVFNDIPQEIFPKEYGGKEDRQAIVDGYLQKLDEKKDWLVDQEKYGVDESKRSGKPKTMNDVFGIEESIKELNVD